MDKEEQISFNLIENSQEGAFWVSKGRSAEMVVVRIDELLYEFLEEWHNGRVYERRSHILAMSDDKLKVYRKRGGTVTLVTGIPKKDCLQVFKEICGILEKKFLRWKCSQVSNMKYGQYIEKYKINGVLCRIENKLMEAYYGKIPPEERTVRNQLQAIENLADEVVATIIADYRANH